ncbi:MAG TPA: HAD-IIA family hydrolase [bacterium]|nr:HAD-IIA family hydrolase [bacterium]
MPRPLRLTLIADIHHGHVTETKAGPSALTLLEQSVKAANDAHPDLSVDFGDRISDLDHDTDMCRLREVAARFRALREPCVHLLGNHDQVNLSIADSESVLGVRFQSRTMDLEGWHLVFWCPSSSPGPHGLYVLKEDELAWLETDLGRTQGPSIVFTHVPFDSGSMIGNYYFEHSPPGNAGYVNADLARHVIRRSGGVVLVVAGHVHWNAINIIDGVPYVTIQSLTETFTTHPHPAAAWARLDVTADTLAVRVFGRDRFELSLPIKPLGHHWLSRSDYTARPEAPGRGSLGAQAPRPLARVRGVILDLDGVIYKEDVLLPGAREFLSFLRESRRRVVAVTNHSGSSAEAYAEKLERLGVSIPVQDIITSAWATAQYLQQHRPRARIAAIGSPALKEELAAVGLVESQTPEYVVVGYDPALGLPQLTEATRWLLNGAVLIGTNADAVLPTRAGFIPECGPVLAFLERASGQRATIIGKPNPFIVDAALARLGVARDEALVVGDTVETDIQAGVTAGIPTALVLTGNMGHAPRGEPHPTVTVPNLDTLRRHLVAGGA